VNCAALYDDVTLSADLDHTVVEFQFNLTEEHDTVVDTVRTMHWRFAARQHVNHANDRPAI
jgi:hypothetical protein